MLAAVAVQIAWVLLAWDAPAAPRAAPAAPTFVQDIRPIFARRCLSCHSGGDATSGLDLDDRASLLRGGESGVPALVPGSPDESRLLLVLDGRDPETSMPPKGGPLAADEIALVRAWIAAGAAHGAAGDGHWHWAYRPPIRPEPPLVSDPAWAATPIDHFVLERLEREGLAPSVPADRATLIRRLSLDLIGLPPSPDEVRAFVADDRPDAYERLVDRLLDSPHYGEHWARLWLDLGRFADTHGYEKDDRRTMWPWRDWLIEAFNHDLPFDQFSIALLAGDQLPDPSLEQVVASGFNRNSQINEEGGTDPEEFRVDAVIDRVGTVASVWLGSTVACAQCHDHKYDPFSQREFYSFYSLFNQDDADVVAGLTETRAAGGNAPWGPPDRREALAALWRERLAAEEAFRDEPQLVAARVDLEAAFARAPTPHFTPLGPTRASGPERVEFILGSAHPTSVEGHSAGGDPLAEGMIALAGASPADASYEVDLALPVGTVQTLRLDALIPPSPYRPAVGRSSGGNFVLTGFEASVVGGDGTLTPLAFASARADFEQSPGQDGEWSAAGALDDNPSTGWAVGGRTDRPHSVWFTLKSPLRVEQPATLRVVLRHDWGKEHTLQRFRVLASSVEPTGGPSNGPSNGSPNGPAPLPPDVDHALRTAERSRRVADRLAIERFVRDDHPSSAEHRARLAALDAKLDAVATARAMVMRADPVGRETRVHLRGDFRALGEPVEPGVPAVLVTSAGTGPTAAPRTRLELARWMVRADHPLTARVAVNRLWERLYGRGIVATSDDFGTQGDPPTHPELLDWLATEFPRQGWSQKKMLRLLVTSSVYRQSSVVSPALLERDPENLLLARMSRFRLDAEAVRDVALAASGLLSGPIGGPSVFPPQPPGIWTMIYSNDQWTESTGADRTRRGLYTFARRTAPYPTFAAFDAPSREIACVRRSRTNTPLQALVTLNDTQFVEAALALARRMQREAGAARAEQLQRGFELCTARLPAPGELALLEELFRAEHAACVAAPESTAARLAALGGAREGEDAATLAALQMVASVLLNLDETLTKD